MMLVDFLHTLTPYHLADLYDTLYQPQEPHAYSEDEYRQAIVGYWSNPRNWEDLITALSPTERQTLTRVALQERCQIDAFLEELSALGLVILHRELNRFEVPDDVRLHVLEYLPRLQDRISAHELADENGAAPV